MNWPEAWQEIQRRWLPDDPERPHNGYEGQMRVKFEVARDSRPKVIAEIGVRAGYSALAMLLAAPEAKYIGIEQDAGQFGGGRGLTARAVPEVLKGFDYEIRYGDSQDVHVIEHEIDLFHIDGDHSYDGAMHDIGLAWDCARFVLVDDYDFIKSVQAACDHFIVTHRMSFPECQALGDGGFRGSMFMVGRWVLERTRKDKENFARNYASLDGKAA